jgi:hypothetical protein
MLARLPYQSWHSEPANLRKMHGVLLWRRLTSDGERLSHAATGYGSQGWLSQVSIDWETVFKSGHPASALSGYAWPSILLQRVLMDRSQYQGISWRRNHLSGARRRNHPRVGPICRRFHNLARGSSSRDPVYDSVVWLHSESNNRQGSGTAWVKLMVAEHRKRVLPRTLAHGAHQSTCNKPRTDHQGN